MDIKSKFQPFFIGGFSGITATSIIQPIDMVKVRIQIKNEQLQQSQKVNVLEIIKEIYKEGGIIRFYKGIDSALTRQVFYTTSRLGIYKTMFNYIKQSTQKEPTLLQKAGCSITAGFLGSIIGNPADLILIRMQNDTTLPKQQQRGYRNIWHASQIVIKEEGVLGLWRGCTPTVVRAVALNLGMLATYDEAKERLQSIVRFKEQNLRLTASAFAGFFAASFSLPFDNAKTKMQKMKKVDGKYPYKNIFHTIQKTCVNEGVAGLWVGFPTYYVRIAPHAMITLIVQDYLTSYLNSNQNKTNK